MQVFACLAKKILGRKGIKKISPHPKTFHYGAQNDIKQILRLAQKK